MEKKRFFEPWIPEKYNEGINGKKILVPVITVKK